MPLQVLKETSKEFRQSFLLAFTRELIKSANPDLREKIEANERELLMEIKEISPEKMPLPLKLTIPIVTSPEKPTRFKTLPSPFKIPPRLRIPRSQLPQRLQYIQPVARQGVQIDLGKLNQLVNDPVIQTIECNGPNERIIIRDPTQKATKITLSKDEINSIIQAFAKTARMPITKGIFRVAAGKLILSAIISDVVGSKFIIKKLRYPQAQTPQQQRPGIPTGRLQPQRRFMR